MIKTEAVTINGKSFTHNYSDSGMQIIQSGTGVYYSEAYDPEGSGRSYIESTTPIDSVNGEDEVTADNIDSIVSEVVNR